MFSVIGLFRLVIHFFTETVVLCCKVLTLRAEETEVGEDTLHSEPIDIIMTSERNRCPLT